MHWRQHIRLHGVANLACNNTVETIQNHRKIVHKLPMASTGQYWNNPINIIRCMGMVTQLYSTDFQALRHSNTFSIQRDTQFTTNQQCKPRISKLWATVARIWPPPRWLWQVPNVPPSADSRTRAISSRFTESASRPARNASSQLANHVQLNSSPRITFRCTWETPDQPPQQKIPAACTAAESRGHRDGGLASIAGHFLQWLWCRWWERWFFGLGRCRRQTADQPVA